MKEITGNLLDPDLGFRAIGHGVNCHGVMGAGIAAAVKDLYPDEMYERYRDACDEGRLRPGMVLPYSAPFDGLPRLYNMASQNTPGADARIDWLWSSLHLALVDCYRRGITELAVPEIGCGIGGLEWDGHESVRQTLWHLDQSCPSVEIVAVHFDG